MAMKSIRAWLGLDAARDSEDQGPFGATLEALDHLEPGRARYLAAFAYLLGRVAHADQHVSADETRMMEALVIREGGLDANQAMVVVHLAQSNHRLFGGTANLMVAREFSALATYEQKLSLLGCLFALAATDSSISIDEEGEIHRIANELRVDRPDLVRLRVAHRRHLPGISGSA
jgi:uncharacterized tellurite resistance protein B-like protein